MEPLEIRLWMLLRTLDLSTIPGRKVTDFLTPAERARWQPLDLDIPPDWIRHEDLSEFGLSLERTGKYLTKEPPGHRIGLGSEKWYLDLESFCRTLGKTTLRTCSDCELPTLAYSWVVEWEASVPLVGSRYRDTYTEWLCPPCHLRETWKQEWRDTPTFNRLEQERRDGGHPDLLGARISYLAQRESDFLEDWTRKDLARWRASLAAERGENDSAE